MWYFTGNYPTPGGNKVVIKSFINFFEKKGSEMIKISETALTTAFSFGEKQ